MALGAYHSPDGGGPEEEVNPPSDGSRQDRRDIEDADVLQDTANTSISDNREQKGSLQLTILNEITATAIRGDDLQESLCVLADQVRQLIDADGSFINRWDAHHQCTILEAVSRAYREQLDQFDIGPRDLKITAQALTGGTPVVIGDVHADESDALSQRLVDQLHIHSALALPLQVGQDKIGAVVVTFDTSHSFTEEEINIVRQAAALISVAIATNQSLENERQQRRFAETQLNFSFRLMETPSLSEAVDSLLETVKTVTNYDAGSVMLLEPGNSKVGYFAAVSGYTDPVEAGNRVVNMQDYPLLRQLQEERRSIYIPDVREAESWQPGQQPDPEEVRSVLMAPLLYNQQSEMVGCLTIKRYHAHAFPQEARDNITLLCNQTASAVRNARLLEETRRRLNEVTILAEMSETLNRMYDLNEVLQMVLARVISILEQASATDKLQGSIILRRQPGDLLQLVASHNMPEAYSTFFNNRPYYAHEGTFARSILQGEWVSLSEPEEVEEEIEEIPDGLEMSALLNIPLKVDAEVIGVITANAVVRDTATQRLLGAVAELAGSAIQKTQLLSQARERAVELMEAYETLNQMDRMRDEFIQNLTHDLKAPLSFIRGYTELMLEGAMGEINPEQKEALDVILERTDAVTRLVGDILKVKQVESQPLRQEPVNLEAIVRNAVRSALMSAKKAELSIDLSVETSNTRVRGDADRLGQVMDNLVSNAIKYTPKGGRINIQLEERYPRLVISVADTGIGIPVTELDRIWDRYYRVKDTVQTHSGTGLGLANVRHIVEAHGGSIWVQSDTKGTQFTLELPVDRERTASGQSGEETGQ